MMLHLVRYSGPFGFIKPWTAVRDAETFSQQFLTPSIVEGIEKKLFPELLDQPGIAGKITRHRLSYSGVSRQQEQTQPRAISEKFEKSKGLVTISRGRSILTRGVLLSPSLWLAFDGKNSAKIAAQQHICLCRNEDVLLPDAEIAEVAEADFDAPHDGSGRPNFDGFELLFGDAPQSFIVGYNRFGNAAPMHGRLHIVGNPIREATP